MIFHSYVKFSGDSPAYTALAFSFSFLRNARAIQVGSWSHWFFLLRTHTHISHTINMLETYHTSILQIYSNHIVSRKHIRSIFIFWTNECWSTFNDRYLSVCCMTRYIIVCIHPISHMLFLLLFKIIRLLSYHYFLFHVFS